MKYLQTAPVGLVAAVLSVTTVNAWHLTGQVKCPNGATYKDVIVRVDALFGGDCSPGFAAETTTDSEGLYSIRLPDCDACFTTTIDFDSLPPNAIIEGPLSVDFCTSVEDDSEVVNWIIDSELCDQARCWFTGGGVKDDPIIGEPVAHKGKWISFGGNVNPGCSPTAGEGGNWNHIDRALNLHFQGRAITVINCGNVEDHPPGSTSPKTPFNYLECEGTGTLKGIQGNKANYDEVSFFARFEDRNEPGAKDANAGTGIDRYYLRVYQGETTLLVVNGDADPLIVVPIEITDGNFQIHISSCDNPLVP